MARYKRTAGACRRFPRLVSGRKELEDVFEGYLDAIRLYCGAVGTTLIQTIVTSMFIRIKRPVFGELKQQPSFHASVIHL